MVGQGFVGKNAGEVQSLVRSRFPVGTPIEQARSELEQSGYDCRNYPEGLEINDGRSILTGAGIMCAGPHIAKAQLHIVVGGLWEITVLAPKGLVAEVGVQPFGSPYS